MRRQWGFNIGKIVIDEDSIGGSEWNGIKLGKAKRGGYSKFRYLQFNNFAISTLFRA
jgi:hypothetical protein